MSDAKKYREIAKLLRGYASHFMALTAMWPPGHRSTTDAQIGRLYDLAD